MNDFLKMFLSQLCAYLLITMNYRAIAQGSYFLTATTDLVFTAFNFGLIKRIAKSESNAALAGYMLGGMVGSLLGIFVSKHI